MKEKEVLADEKSNAGLPQKADGVDAKSTIPWEASFPYNFYNQPRETEDSPREFSEFDPQTW
jgi:hypothetical protein